MAGGDCVACRRHYLLTRFYQMMLAWPRNNRHSISVSSISVYVYVCVYAMLFYDLSDLVHFLSYVPSPADNIADNIASVPAPGSCRVHTPHAPRE